MSTTSEVQEAKGAELDQSPGAAESPQAVKPKLKIVLVSSEFPPETGFGGIGTYVAQLAPALVELGHEVTVLSRSVDARDTEAFVDGVRVVRVFDREAPASFWQEPFVPAHAKIARDHYNRAYTVALAFEADARLRSADIIEAPDWAGEAALIPLICPGTPYVVKFHTPAKLVFAWNGAGVGADFVNALHALERIAVRNALGFTSPSRWLVPEVAKLFDVPQVHVHAIANPFSSRVNWMPRTPEKTVLYVGRLEARKGVFEALAPMAQLLRRDTSLRWRLAGADTKSGPGGASVRETILKLLPSAVHGRVEFLGSLDRTALAGELARAGVVLLPSRHENFPYTCLEAMAAGAPVVGSQRGGMGEMIEHGRSGLLVDPSKGEEIFDSLLRVLEQPLFAESLARRARDLVHARYRPEVIAPQVEGHYRQVIALSQST